MVEKEGNGDCDVAASTLMVPTLCSTAKLKRLHHTTNFFLLPSYCDVHLTGHSLGTSFYICHGRSNYYRAYSIKNYVTLLNKKVAMNCLELYIRNIGKRKSFCFVLDLYVVFLSCL